MFVICRKDDRHHFRRRTDGLPLIFETHDDGNDFLLARPELIGDWYVRAVVGRDWASTACRRDIKRARAARMLEEMHGVMHNSDGAWPTAVDVALGR